MHPAITRSIVALCGAAAVFSSLATPQLAQKNKCLACHSVGKKVVGPAYEDVSRKYKGRKDAEETVMANIKNGGHGKWGDARMPPQTGLSDADSRALAKWILGTSK